MFAGAAREAVFSRPEVIRRVNAEFVPLAVRATLANQVEPAGDPAEGRLYARLKRAQAAPQGLCVLNADGQVLDWVLTFEDDRRVAEFLDYSLRRFCEHPSATGPVSARRYSRYPGERMPDVPDEEPTAIAAAHAAGHPCPAAARAKAAAPPGSVAAQVIGRSLGSDGRLSADTVNQEHYAQDHFAISLELQKAVAAAVAAPGSGPAPLPEPFGRLCATYAYLGHLDVRPLDNPRRGRGELKRCAFSVERPAGGTAGPLRVAGQTEVAGEMAGPGGHSHQVTLEWEGFLELDGERITRLLLSARGTERLQYRSPQGGLAAPEEASLPAGRSVDQEGGVRYALIGAPVPGAPRAGAPEPTPGPPDGNPGMVEPRHLVALLGPQFTLFLPRVQEELKLSPEQRGPLRELLAGASRGVQEFMQSLAPLPPEAQEQKRQEFREQANKNLGMVLGQLLKPEQHVRLRQIVLQQEGLFAVGNPELARELKLTDAQSAQVATLLQETQKRFQALQQRAAAGGKPEELQREAPAIRGEQERKIDALLTAEQRARWKEMLDAPLALAL